MKKPEKISDAQVCPDCETDWKKKIVVHAIEKKFKDERYLTWANEDGTTHTLSKQYDYVHVWNNEEVDIGKNKGGTAGLKAHREKEVTMDSIAVENTQGLMQKDLLLNPPTQTSKTAEVSTQKPENRFIDAIDAITVYAEICKSIGYPKELWNLSTVWNTERMKRK